MAYDASLRLLVLLVVCYVILSSKENAQAAKPVFTGTPASVTVNECEIVAKEIYSLVVADPDGDPFTCTLQSSFPVSTDFSVTGTTNVVNLKANPTLTSDTYKLTVECGHGGPPDTETAVVQVDVIKNQNPVIDQINDFNIAERGVGGEENLQCITVTDNDAGQVVTCSLQTVSPVGPFTVKWVATGTEYCAFYDGTAALESASYTLTVLCVDDCSGSDTEQFIININKNRSPNITSLMAQVSIKENQPAGDLHTMAVYDPEGDSFFCEFSYSVPPGGPFDVQVVGTDYIIKLLSSPGNSVGSYRVYVNCTQAVGEPEVGYLIVDIIPNDAPTFINIPDDNTKSAMVIKKNDLVFNVDAIDLENDTITYSISYAPNTGSFEIDPATGWITATRDLDIELENFFTFEVTATAGSKNTTDVYRLTLTDLNTPPAITNLNKTIYIKEFDLVGGDNIFTFDLYDPDVGQNINYTMTVSPLNDQNMFVLDQAGAVTLAPGMAFDYETQRDFKATIYVTDGIHTTGPYFLEVIIMNENEPCEFERDTYYATDFEGLRDSGYMDAAIQAVDPDGETTKLSLRTTAANSDFFKIDPLSGVITFNRDIDREAHPANYTFILECTEMDRNDGTQLTATATVHITIKDVNDNEPEFRECVLYFNQYDEPGELVASFATFDIDYQENQELEYFPSLSAGNTYLKLSSNGDVHLITQPDFDYGTSFRYNIIVKDRGNPVLSETYTCDIFYRRITTTTIVITTVTAATGWWEDWWHILLVVALALLALLCLLLLLYFCYRFWPLMCRNCCAKSPTKVKPSPVKTPQKPAKTIWDPYASNWNDNKPRTNAPYVNPSSAPAATVPQTMNLAEIV